MRTLYIVTACILLSFQQAKNSQIKNIYQIIDSDSQQTDWFIYRRVEHWGRKN
jgi:hypothetical protein